MNIEQTAATVRPRTRILALAALLGIAISSVAVPSAQATDNRGITPDTPCYIPGSTLPYVAGEKATFSKDGQPAKEYTCQKDGTWTAAMRWPGGWAVDLSDVSGTLTSVAP